MESKDKALGLAMEMRHAGRHDEAVRICRKLLRRNPTHHRALALLAHAALDAGQHRPAAEAAEQLTGLQPDQATAWNLLGRARLFLGDPQAALIAQQRAVQLAPDDPWAWAQLGIAQKMLGDLDAALDALEKGHGLAPDIDVIRYNFTLALLDADRSAQAEALCRAALDDEGRGPADLEHALGMTLIAQNRPREAMRLLRSSVTRHPTHPGLRADYGCALASIGEGHRAVPELREALRQDPDNLVARDNLVKVLTHLGLIVEALEELNRLAATPGYLDNPALRRAILLDILGNHDEATAIADGYLDDSAQRLVATGVLARGARKTGRADEAIARIQRLLAEVPFESSTEADREQIIRLEFALGGLLDQRGDTEDAFDAYARGNRHRRLPFDREEDAQLVERLIATYTRDAIASLPRASLRSGVPIFIVGMPRSGTSLLEQMLDCHPEIHGAGELLSIPNLLRELGFELGADYPEFADRLTKAQLDDLAASHVATLREIAPCKPRVVDKLPANYQHLGFISRLLPDARVIHCRRRPEATALSIFFQNFTHTTGHTYANDLGDIGFRYRQYLRLMAHWREVLPLEMIDIDYEQLVSSPEAVTRELCAYLGVEWHAEMLHFHESQRVTATASMQQVREELYDSALGHWERYADRLAPFRRELGASPAS